MIARTKLIASRLHHNFRLEIGGVLECWAIPKGPAMDPGETPSAATYWVKPEVVAEIQFTEWTQDGTIRHGVFLGVRDDKSGVEVVRELPTAAAARYAGPGAVVTGSKLQRGKSRPKKAARRPKAAPAVIDARRVDAGGVTLTHPDKVLWPKEGFTKADLAAFWERAAPFALPYIAGRPLALVRCPEGIAGERFFQKKLTAGFPAAVREVRAGRERLITIDDAEGLAGLSQMAAIEIHPWGSTVEDIEHPTYIVFDLDPDPSVPFVEVTRAALEVRDALAQAGLASFCKTTGGKGLHVVVPLNPAPAWEEAKAFAHALASDFRTRLPDRFIDAMSKKARRGRIFIDYLRNGRGATAIAPFCPRARDGATIAMPLKWTQVTRGLEPSVYTVKATAADLKAAAAAWAGFLTARQALTPAARKRFGQRTAG